MVKVLFGAIIGFTPSIYLQYRKTNFKKYEIIRTKFFTKSVLVQEY